MERLRVGIIGCGGAAGWHAASLLGLGEVTVVGLADPSEANRDRIRSRVPALAETPTFAGADELYDAVELDAVEIITPHVMHYPQVMSAIEHRLHVLCEKPLACEPGHAREIEAAARAAGVEVMVSYQRRVDPAYSYMRRAIEQGELGDIRAIDVCCGQNWQKLTRGKWRQDPELSGGGMLMDSGSHLADMLLWLVDRPVVSVSALVDNLGSPVDINSAVTVGFAGGAQGQLTVVGDLPAAWIETVLVTGANGVLRYENDPQHPWRTGRVVHYRDGGIVQPLGLQGPASPDTVWLDAIRGRSPNPAPPAAGVRVAELIAAIYDSARTGATVNLASVDSAAV